MKKYFNEKRLAFFIVFVVFLVCGYLYLQGKIFFLPKKNDLSELKNTMTEIPYMKKEYRLTYSDRSLDKVEYLSHFEDVEKWQGDGEFDYTDFVEGKSSLSLSSQNHSRSKAILELPQSLNFSDFSKLKLFLDVRSGTDKIEDLVIVLFQGNGQEAARYPIRELQAGWNLLTVPQKDFSEDYTNGPYSKKGSGFKEGEVKRVSFELISRPKTSASVNLDLMWIEKEDNYIEDWNTDTPKILSLGKTGSSFGLLVSGIGGNLANLREISSAKNFSFSAKFIALKLGNFGLFLRGNYQNGFGYYFMMDGVGAGSWEIYKIGQFDNKVANISLAKGIIQNFELTLGTPFWLKAELKGTHLTFLLSVDGENFIKIGETDDRSFSSGGAGIFTANSMYLVDDFQFNL
ncbi:MAG: hypothetical protein BWY24_00444 [Microgenomates group bacterium ADurb.Bin219]|nr:MAG: hypothetical protein BWY24_00444 [Microgenomates group bacterium ADurb.Bin219]